MRAGDMPEDEREWTHWSHWLASALWGCWGIAKQSYSHEPSEAELDWARRVIAAHRPAR